MKAYVKRADPDGFIRLGGGSTRITKEYKTVKALLQYGATPFLHVWGGVVEVYKNWDNRYGEPDMKVTVLGNVPAQIEELEKRRPRGRFAPQVVARTRSRTTNGCSRARRRPCRASTSLSAIQSSRGRMRRYAQM